MGQKILGFRDLNVYQRAYEASITVMTELAPKLPHSERHDLKDQLSRSAKAIPRLIAEGYAKRNQVKGFQKYLVDALGECNEIQVSLNHCRDLYSSFLDKKLCDDLDKGYDIIGKQLYRLSESWTRVKGNTS